MKIAIYTLTRDRLEYTKHCFASLQKNAGLPYDHFVVDNGSTDGTPEWLTDQNLHHVTLLRENNGISKASNLMLDQIFKEKYDLIIKMDNDCEVVSENILAHLVSIFNELNNKQIKILLSPRVAGINNQPHRSFTITASGYTIGITAIVGGLFHIVQANVYSGYRYPLQLPLARGQDEDFCEWARIKNIRKGYIEDLVVNHYETTTGQAERFPEYFKRKWKEEKI